MYGGLGWKQPVPEWMRIGLSSNGRESNPSSWVLKWIGINVRSHASRNTRDMTGRWNEHGNGNTKQTANSIRMLATLI